MGKSTNSPARDKSTDRFPLWVHSGRGLWARKHQGKVYYFERVANDPKGEKSLAQWLLIAAGRTPGDNRDATTIKDVCDRFCTVKKLAMKNGRLSKSSFDEYVATAKRIAAHFGRLKPIIDLTPADFEKFNEKMPQSWGPWRRSGEIQRTRSLFKYGFEAGLIERPVIFGPAFKKPSKKEMRVHRNKRGKRMFSAEACRAIIDATEGQMKAMVLLALNAGFGNDDCGKLTLEYVDLDRGWVDFPRPKTGIDRVCPLWPETIAAIREVIEGRELAPTDLIFRTKYGQSWSKVGIASPLSAEFRKLLKRLKLHSDGIGFYTLRRVFRTIADGARDEVATNLIMGHVDDSMGDTYRQYVDDDRLRRVVDQVHAWLWPTIPTAQPGGQQ